MDKVKLKNEKEYDTDLCVCDSSRNILYIRLPGMTFMDVAMAFSDSEATSGITCGQDVYTGFTRMAAIIDEGDALRVNMEAVK